MGFAKKKKRVRSRIKEWGCHGFYGYGEGRAVADFGEDELRGRSACDDICTKRDSCRIFHHERMDRKYPMMAELVGKAALVAKYRGMSIDEKVSEAIEKAYESGASEAVDVISKLKEFNVTGYVDHYRSGQFENIQNGLDKVNLNEIYGKNKK